MHQFRRRFSRAAQATTHWAGSYWAFILAISTILIWVPFGPLMHYSDSWQLIANTGTTLVTYLMVFLIQHTQNHEGRAMQMKLDAILRAQGNTSMVGIEHLPEEDLRQMEEMGCKVSGMAGVPSGTPSLPVPN